MVTVVDTFTKGNEKQTNLDEFESLTIFDTRTTNANMKESEKNVKLSQRFYL